MHFNQAVLNIIKQRQDGLLTEEEYQKRMKREKRKQQETRKGEAR